MPAALIALGFFLLLNSVGALDSPDVGFFTAVVIGLAGLVFLGLGTSALQGEDHER